MSTRIAFLLCHVNADEGSAVAEAVGRIGLRPLYWWRGSDGTRYYTPPLRGREVCVDRNGVRYFEEEWPLG